MYSIESSLYGMRGHLCISSFAGLGVVRLEPFIPTKQRHKVLAKIT